MLTKHLFKVIIGFCGVILVGLISLVVIDSFRIKDTKAKAEVTTVDVTNKPTNPNKPNKINQNIDKKD